GPAGTGRSQRVSSRGFAIFPTEPALGSRLAGAAGPAGGAAVVERAAPIARPLGPACVVGPEGVVGDVDLGRMCTWMGGNLRMLSIGALAAKVFGTSNDRRLRAYRPNVEAINALEGELEQLSDGELRARTELFRKQLSDGVQLDDLLVPAFATVREAAKRTLG